MKKYKIKNTLFIHSCFLEKAFDLYKRISLLLYLSNIKKILYGKNHANLEKHRKPFYKFYVGWIVSIFYR